MSSLMCVTGSDAFLPRHQWESRLQQCAHSTDALFSFYIYHPSLISFIKSHSSHYSLYIIPLHQITNMSSNYHQYNNDDSNYFLKVPNNNTDFGEISPNYAQTSSYANEVSTFNPIGCYPNYSNSSFYLESNPPVQSNYLNNNSTIY
jgi:hypothetical protein